MVHTNYGIPTLSQNDDGNLQIFCLLKMFLLQEVCISSVTSFDAQYSIIICDYGQIINWQFLYSGHDLLIVKNQ